MKAKIDKKEVKSLLESTIRETVANHLKEMYGSKTSFSTKIFDANNIKIIKPETFYSDLTQNYGIISLQNGDFTIEWDFVMDARNYCIRNFEIQIKNIIGNFVFECFQHNADVENDYSNQVQKEFYLPNDWKVTSNFDFSHFPIQPESMRIDFPKKTIHVY